MFFKKSYCLATALFALCCLSGCAKNNTVALNYGPPAATVQPSAGSPSVCVVLLADARGKPEIGVRSNGEFYMPKTPPADWASRAMADELAQQGFVVTYATDMAMAGQSSPDYTVTGTLDDLWVEEASSITFKTRMQISVTLLAKGKTIFKESVSSSLSKKVFPMTSPADALLKESLQDLLKPLTLKLSQKIQ